MRRERQRMRRWLSERRRQRRLVQLDERYRILLLEARDLQRRGDIQAFAARTAEAEALGQQLDALREQRAVEQRGG